MAFKSSSPPLPQKTCERDTVNYNLNPGQPEVADKRIKTRIGVNQGGTISYVQKDGAKFLVES